MRLTDMKCCCFAQLLDNCINYSTHLWFRSCIEFFSTTWALKSPGVPCCSRCSGCGCCSCSIGIQIYVQKVMRHTSARHHLHSYCCDCFLLAQTLHISRCHRRWWFDHHPVVFLQERGTKEETSKPLNHFISMWPFPSVSKIAPTSTLDSRHVDSVVVYRLDYHVFPR